ncbi:DNA methyltransferase (plasmid) [Rhodococcus sp. p52]|uniref:site-specific DNA-methyltransferase n=1 Tax=Rhodococcus sp. p52 TaxID=935199 RepID=UPI00051A6202|nr:DNA methyltransferase [Rhodococcus sp. p52]AOD24744.1 DNA methyltransferase [Rhodococcus sp. p52]
MSRLNDLIRHVANMDPQLAKDLQRETDALAERRPFGLNFERHTPEAVELPGRPVRKNDKVRILPDRGEMPKKENERLYRVARTYTEEGQRWADVVAVDDPDEGWSVLVEDLVVVAEFRDPIYPGLVSTGKVERGGDKPFHTVINSENYHALQALLFTHRGKVDAIYIDPPYNTGAKDWKYNNDYVESDDHYRHSKWLAFMERRLFLAKELLNPDDSVLIVTIDEKEYLRLGLLLEQLFPEARIQMVTSVISQRGVARDGTFARVDEYLFFVFIGSAKISFTPRDLLGSVESEKPRQMWFQFRRNGEGSLRVNSPNLFYPLLIEPETRRIISVGDPLPLQFDRREFPVPAGLEAVWPLREDGTEARWRTGVSIARRNAEAGYLRVGPMNEKKGLRPVLFINEGGVKAIESGEIEVLGRGESGEVLLGSAKREAVQPKTVWNSPAHDPGWHGSRMLASFLPGIRFPYPKSLYAVEDSLSIYVADKPEAVILDFFAGSGTTAHATFRLNKRDGGHRRSIVITNNEVSAEDQKGLRAGGLRPGDPEWEQWGICDHITKPRIEAAVTGKTPMGEPIKGDYKFTDEFPMADGFEENVEFFTLSYESAMRVSSNREFAKVAPFLWLRAGARGRRIDDVSTGWDVADAYGVIANLDLSEPFIKTVEAQEGLTHAFIVTDEDRLFEAMVRQLPEHVEPVRLYSSYLRNFEIEAGRAAR